MEHICHFPCCFCCVSFNCMCQCIHTCRSCQSLWHRRHHVWVYNCDDWHIVWVNTHKFSFLFYICDNIVDCYLCCCSCCCWNCDDWYTRFLCRCNTFQTSNIFKFRVCNDDTDCFCCIHRRTATNSNNVISSCFLKCFYSMLYIFDCWVGFDIRINFILKSCIFQHFCYFCCYFKFNQIRIRTYKCFFVSSCFCLCCNFPNCTCSMIRCFIQHNSVCHFFFSLSVLPFCFLMSLS